MNEKRFLNIQNKVLRPADLRKTASTFYEIYEGLLRRHHGDVDRTTLVPKVGFVFHTLDAEYSSDDLDIVKADGILDDKVITAFTYHVSYFGPRLDLTLSLADTRFRSWNTNSVQVSGNDNDWVNGTFQQLEDTISKWETQRPKIKKYRWPISIFLSVMILWILGTIFTYIYSLLVSDFDTSYYFTFPILAMFLIVAPTMTIAGYIADLWPNIEFVPGPEHERTLIIKRRRLAQLFTIIIIPGLFLLFNSLFRL